MCILTRKSLMSINDLSEIQILPRLEADRKKYKILVIDDDGFAQKESLIKLGYKDIEVKYHYENMEEYKAYDIILCDINGVGTEIDEHFQGAALAKKIKELYPDKYVVIFSAMEQYLDFNPYYTSVDDIIIKNLNSNQFSEKLDSYISKLNNPEFRWNAIKKILEQNNIATKDIAYFEHYYVKSIKEKTNYSNKIEKYCKKNIVNVNNITEMLTYIFKIVAEALSIYANK